MPPVPDAHPALDLEAYFLRIQWQGDRTPTLPTLQGLQTAHLAAIPFENLDVQMGIPIRLDLASLQDKLVRRRRGGYCFEQNSLFAEVLRTLGFQVALREARVRRGAPRLLPRTHLALEVALPEGPSLADVGFGSDGPLGPIPMDGQEVRRGWECCRILAEGPRQVLQILRPEGWLDLYALEPGTVHPVDLDMASHYTSTHPDSRFVRTLAVQRTLREGRWSLHNLELAFRGPDREELRTLEAAELLPALRRHFGLEIPAGTGFRFQEYET
jgi:N-hydroxyarylamine O-acetyltransferase